MKITIRLLVFIITISVCFSQNKTVIDSLLQLMKIAKEDTIKVKLLNDIAMELRFADPKTALIKTTEAIALSKKLKYIKGEAKALNISGLFYNALSDFKKAIEFHEKALELYSMINDSIGVAKALHNIGFAYSISGEIKKTIEYYLKSLKIAEKMNDYKLKTFNSNKIGECYSSQGDYTLALKYYQNALDFSEKEGDMEMQSSALNSIGLVFVNQNKNEIALGYFMKSFAISEKVLSSENMAAALNNIGIVYDNLKQPEMSLKYYLKSLKIKEEIGNIYSVVSCYSNIALIYRKKGDLKQAIEYNMKALAIDERLDDKQGLCLDYFNLADIETEQKNYQKAGELFDKSLSIAEKSHYREYLPEIYGGLSQLYANQKQYQQAYQYFKLFSQYKDSILNEKSSKHINEMQAKYESEKKQIAIGKLEKEKQLQISENKKQQLIILFVVGGLIFLAGFFVLLFRLFLQKKKANKIITEKNNDLQVAYEEINSQKEEIIVQRDSIQEQKELIEIHQKETEDSINYAKNIQQAVMHDENYLSSLLSPSSNIDSASFEDTDYFVFFQPKDIVSGDFYWFTCVNDWLIITVADCTGHGVPGAFMSMLGISFLNEIVRKKEVTQANHVLNNLREYVIEALKQKGQKREQKDGMDIALCVINMNSLEMQFAGANNSCYVITNFRLPTSDFRLIELKPDKQPIGIHSNMQPFTNQLYQLKQGDTIYLLSDGYEDQFGGPNRKKFLAKNLKNLLTANSQKPMAEQKQILETKITDWIGNGEQIDDITVMGIKI